MKKIVLFSVLAVFSLIATSGVHATTVKLKNPQVRGRITGMAMSTTEGCKLSNPCTANICGYNSLCEPEMDGTDYSGYYFCSCTKGASPTSDGKNCNDCKPCYTVGSGGSCTLKTVANGSYNASTCVLSCGSGFSPSGDQCVSSFTCASCTNGTKCNASSTACENCTIGQPCACPSGQVSNGSGGCVTKPVCTSCQTYNPSNNTCVTNNISGGTYNPTTCAITCNTSDGFYYNSDYGYCSNDPCNCKFTGTCLAYHNCVSGGRCEPDMSYGASFWSTHDMCY